jgi:DNA-binding SARP family transcriptional activator/tetratricopeptide (TPR) repeat protein
MHRDRGDGGLSWPGADQARRADADLGALIAGGRRAAGLTQRELAGLAGVGLGTVRDVEQGRRPRSRSAPRLAGVLGLDVARAGERARQAAGAVAADRGAGPPAGVGGGLWLGVLGPLEAWRAGIRVGLGPPRQRAVLGLLAVSPDELVRRESIVDALWGEDPPATAVNLVQAYVSRLRRFLDPGRPPRDGDRLVVSAGTSYRLRAGAVALDLLAFGQIVDNARAARSAGDAGAACGLYEDALGLWRGEPLADVDLLRGHPVVAGLAGRRAAVVLEYAEAASAAGWDERVLPRLEALATAEPLNERAHARLMIALASAGRQDAALRVHEELRRRLDDQLGVRPGPELTDAHLRVLRQELPGAPRPGRPGPAATAGTATTPSAVPRQLPAAVANFVGRTGELETLTALLEQVDGAASTAVISAIGGTAGVGKTALAVYWAHLAVERFPDGQLYVNLRGYDPGQPVTAADALAGFLRALGVPGQDISPDEDERAARYRSLLAGKRVLVVLDNAGSVEQVRPLLPGTPACTVVVTSRDSLAGLVARDGAVRLELDLLPPDDAVSLLRALVGVRVDADPGAAAALADRCCRLPLALRVAAELAAARPDASLAGLVDELAGHRRRLDLLEAGGDSRTAVRAVFSWSYRHLDDGAARAFRLAGLHPAADLDVYAAAALTGDTLEQSGRVLGVLARAHLIRATGPGRFSMHDLLRGYARELADAQDSECARHAALTSLFDHYLHTAAAAMDILHPAEHLNRPAIRPSATPAPPLPDLAAARAWLDAQRFTLVAVAGYMAERGWPGHATRLAASLSRYLDVGGHYPEAVTMHTCARNAARRNGDRAAEARALTGLGLVDLQQARWQQAGGRFEQALAIFREAGDRAGETQALASLGPAEFHQGLWQQATGHIKQALALGRETGDQTVTARLLNTLGIFGRRLGRFQEAADYHRQALPIFRETGDQYGEALALSHLGHAQFRLGHFQEAAAHLQRATAMLREIGARKLEALSLSVLGDVELRQGRPDQAAGHHRQALAIFRETGHREGEAKALNSLGEALCASGRPDEARPQHAAALGLADQPGDEDEQARAHDGLAHCYHSTGDLGRARHHWRQALAICAGLGDPRADQVRLQLGRSGDPGPPGP